MHSMATANFSLLLISITHSTSFAAHIFNYTCDTLSVLSRWGNYGCNCWNESNKMTTWQPESLTQMELHQGTKKNKRLIFYICTYNRQGLEKKLQKSFLRILIKSGYLDMCSPVKCASWMHCKAERMWTPGFIAIQQSLCKFFKCKTICAQNGI
jgi:hypothetical protein